MAPGLIAILLKIAPTACSLITAIESATISFSVKEAAHTASARERKSCGPMESRRYFSCAS